MKKILLIILAIASPLFAQLQTNKLSNTAFILTSNSSFTFLKGPIVAGYQLTTDANGVATWQPASSGAGDVFAGSNNVFTASNTFNGVTTNNGSVTASNVLVRGTLTVQGLTTLETNLYVYKAGTSVRVGINTNAPNAILDIHSGGDTNAILFNIVGSGTRNAPYISVTNMATGNIFLIDKGGNITANSPTTLINGSITVTNNLTVSNIFSANNNGVVHSLGSLSISALNIFGSGNGINVGGGGSGLVILHPTGGNNVLVRGTGMTITNSLVVSNSLVVARGTTQIGTNGTAITFIKSATSSLDFPNILAAASADLTVTVGGATTNDIVTLGRPFDEDSSLVTRGFVSSNDTVTVRANNVGSIAVDQGSKTYRVDVQAYR